MLKGIALKVAAAFLFTVMSAMIKHKSAVYPIGEIVVFRSFVAMIVLVVWLYMRGEFPGALKTRRPLGHVGRGIAGSGGMFFSFIAVVLLPLPDATAIGYAAPLMTVVLAAVLLKETVRIYRWSAVAVGFLGVLLMLRDHLGEGLALGSDGGLSRGSLGAMVALAAAVCAAIATIQTRRLTQTERTGAIVFYFSMLTTLAGLLVCLAAALWQPGWAFAQLMMAQKWVTPGFVDLILLLTIGTMGGLGQIFMTESYRYADASIIACFDYTSMLWALALGVFFFNEHPSWSVLAGAGVVAAAGIFVIWRERRLGLIQKEARQAGGQRPL